VTDNVASLAAAVATARSVLADARFHLEDAVSSMSPRSDETVIASSIVVHLLGRVVAAQRELDELQTPRTPPRPNELSDKSANPSLD
jgi:hypothetical protein